MGSSGRRTDCNDGAWRARFPSNWMRTLLIQALLLSCLSLMSASDILVFDEEEVGEHCTELCDAAGNADGARPCNSSDTDQLKKKYTCNMTDFSKDKTLRINTERDPKWGILEVKYAPTVKLEKTSLAPKIILISVQKIVLDPPSLGMLTKGFTYLSLEDCHIGDKYTLSFNSLRELHIDSSEIENITQMSMNEIDILNGSRIKKLSADLEKYKSTFEDSSLDTIQMLHITQTAKLVITNMTIKHVKNMKYSSNNVSTVSSSYINKISSLVILESAGKLEFDGVEIDEIVANGFIVMGKVKLSNSVIEKALINSIVMNGSGEITFNNVTINGNQLSYTLKADPSFNGTVNALHLSVITFTSSIVCWVIIAVLAVVSVVLLVFAIKPALEKRKTKVTKDPEINRKIISDDSEKASRNHYTNKVPPQDIPMTPINEFQPNRQERTAKNGGGATNDLSSSNLAASVDSFDESQLPAPPPQILAGSGNSPQPFYDDVGGPDSKNSFLYSLNKESARQKNTVPSPNVQPSWQASPAQLPNAPLQPPRPLLPPHPSPKPAAALSPLAVPSHYATRGTAKPPPPPRCPPTHRKVSQPTGVPVIPSVGFQPTHISDYQDTVEEEPIYASEDDLKNY